MSAQDVYRYSHTIDFYAQMGRGFNNPVDVALAVTGFYMCSIGPVRISNCGCPING